MNKLHNPETVAPPFSNYSHAVEATQNAHVLFISGQVGIAPDGTMAEGIEAQTEQALKNVREALRAANMDFEDVTRLNTYLVNREDIAKVRGVRDGIWAMPGRPRRSCWWPGWQRRTGSSKSRPSPPSRGTSTATDRCSTRVAAPGSDRLIPTNKSMQAPRARPNAWRGSPWKGIRHEYAP